MVTSHPEDWEDGLPIEIEEFLAHLTSERGRARNTVAAYRRDLAAYVRHLSERGATPLGASRTDIEE